MHRILLLEDNPADVRLAKEAFRECDVSVELHVANDGEKALEILSSDVNLDLAILDLNVPKKNGKEILRHIKGDEKLKTLPVIMLTTSNASIDVNEAYNAHVNCYIRKPVDIDDFLVIVKKIKDFWLETVILPSSCPS